ncbi:MAG: hypothetical protein DYH08_08915 [Actinobacteria bacterium ATB1]|nr:hypothetical protein [Actinobacteria bacterium ATB1]
MPEQLKTAYQFSRIAIGAAAFLAPGVFGKIAFGGEGGGRGSAVLSRMAGIRDIALGLGQVLGERHGSARGFYEGAALADIGDMFAFGIGVLTGDISKPKAVVGMAVAGSGAALGILYARARDTGDDLDAELAELTRTAAAVEDMG